MMRLLRRDGALTIRDIEDDVLTEKEHLWQSRKPSKRALQLAFYTGEVTISERTGMLEDLRADGAAFRLGQAAEAGSVGGHHRLPARSRAALSGHRQPGLDSAISTRRARGGAAPDRRHGCGAGTGAGRARGGRQAGALGSARGAEADGSVPAGEGDAGLVHVLSPFDPLIIQRKRTELFFGYGHRFEAYVPKEESACSAISRCRSWSAKTSLPPSTSKTDRRNKKLLMQKWSWVGKGAAGRARKDYKRRIEEELDRFERFQLAE